MELFHKQYNILEEPEMNGFGQNRASSSLDLALQMEAVVDLPIINTRAGLYIFLNALVSMLKLSSELGSDSSISWLDVR
jgi:mediator of RNA polymerase II transcription subunit 5